MNDYFWYTICLRSNKVNEKKTLKVKEQSFAEAACKANRTRSMLGTGLTDWRIISITEAEEK